MDFAHKVFELSDLADELRDKKKKKPTPNSLSEDFAMIRKSLEVVDTVVNNEPAAAAKLFSKNVLADKEVENLCTKALETMSLVSKISSPAAPIHILQKIDQIEKGEQPTRRDIPSFLEDSASLMSIHYKVHVGSMEQQRSGVSSETADGGPSFEVAGEETIWQNNFASPTFSRKKPTLEECVKEVTEKNKQFDEEEEFEKACPEQKKKILEKRLREEQEQNSWVNRVVRIGEYAEALMSGRVKLDKWKETVDAMKEAVEPSRKREAELVKQHIQIQNNQRLEEALFQMKKAQKLKDFPTEMDIPHDYLLSASEGISLEHEPYKSHLTQMMEENLRNCPPAEYAKAKAKNLFNMNSAIRMIQTDTVKEALLAPFGMDEDDIPKKLDCIDQCSEKFMRQAYDMNKKNDPKFVNGNLSLPKDFRQHAWNDFKMGLSQLVEEIETEVS